MRAPNHTGWFLWLPSESVAWIKTKGKVLNAAIGFGFFHDKKELLQNCV